MNEETWRDIPGYTGLYAVSTLGRIWAYEKRAGWKTRPGCFMAGSVSNRCYKQVVLCKDGKPRCWLVSVLVLFTFVGPKPLGHIAEHRNNDTMDNVLSNLRWATQTQNCVNKAPQNGKLATGVKCLKNGRFEVRVKKAGKLAFYKIFDTFEEAVNARKYAVKDLHGLS